MISKKMEQALNKQLNNEFFSAYLYLAMSAWSENRGLKGFANWFYVQYQEENFHAMKFYTYLLDQGAEVDLLKIDKPETKFSSPLEAFEKTLEHEQFITKSIYELVDLALSEKDHATNAFLQWFITEQVEEEASVNEIIDNLKLVDGQGNGIFMIDKELGTRTFAQADAGQ
ncbi:MAG TPA: ferritin [Flexistipes sinusarabici]|uniref:Ferritin n=1 Tax=Flexistipes sinusarabici TaxID=2352 RepID=A0A3D5QBU6_FLESI|nr:ferritin [Flexistipes sinusarabici]